VRTSLALPRITDNQEKIQWHFIKDKLGWKPCLLFVSLVQKAQRLFDCHAALFPTGRSGMSRINVGAWCNDKDGSMQVVSGTEF
jgi:hypothetical protein